MSSCLTCKTSQLHAFVYTNFRVCLQWHREAHKHVSLLAILQDFFDQVNIQETAEVFTQT